MSPKRIIIQRISCTWNTDTNKETAGFQVSGHKDAGQGQSDTKVGFIISGIKIIAFQPMIGKGIRSRIKWIPSGFEIREEIQALDGVIVDTQRQNNVIFVDGKDNSAVVMQGEPTIKENDFIGQLLHVNWEENEIQIFPLQKHSSLHCVLSPKNNRIDCLVK